MRGNLFSQAIQVLSLPLLSRIYTPHDFGIFSVFIAFTGFASLSLSLRFESAVLIADSGEVHQLARLAAKFVVPVTALLVGLMLGLIESAEIGFGILPSWTVAIAGVTLLGFGMFNLGRSIALRNGQVRDIAGARVEKSIGNVSTKLIGGLLLSGPIGLLLGEVVGIWVGCRRFAGNLKSDLLSSSEVESLPTSELMHKYRKFYWLELPSVVLDQAALMLPVALIAALGGAAAAGAYGMARIVVVLPNVQIGRAFADGFQWKVAEMVRAGRYKWVHTAVLKTMGVLAAIGFIPFATLYLLSSWGFPYVLGHKWALSGEFASILALWMYAAFVVSPISRILSVLKRQELKLLYDSYVISAIVILFLIAQHTGMAPMRFVSWLVLLNIVGYGLYLLLILFASTSYSRVGSRRSKTGL